MKRYSETKTVSQFSQKWKETKCINPSRRNTIASTTTHHLDSFEELARNIALSRTDKSFSYNINKSLSEENAMCVQTRKMKQNGAPDDTFHVYKEKIIGSKKVDFKNIKSERERRQSSAATGSKISLAISGEKNESSATRDRRNIESTHKSRYQQITKRIINSPAADKRKPLKGSTCTECTFKCDKKCSVVCKNSKDTHTRDKINNGKCDREIEQDSSIEEAKVENCSEKSKGVTELTNENGRLPLLKMSYSDSKICSDSESSIVENDTSYDANLINENTGAQLSPSALEMEYMKRKRSGGSSASPVRSRVSSGSRKSSLSQRSELSMTSTTSTGSLAEKIIESRALRNREILRDRESGSIDSQDFLPRNFSTRRFSVNSEGSSRTDALVMYPKGSGSSASYPILNSNRNERNEQTNSDNSLQKSERSLTGSKKHLPDDVPKVGENSVRIRMYKRKQTRKVLEA